MWMTVVNWKEIGHNPLLWENVTGYVQTFFLAKYGIYRIPYVKPSPSLQFCSSLLMQLMQLLIAVAIIANLPPPLPTISIPQDYYGHGPCSTEAVLQFLLWIFWN